MLMAMHVRAVTEMYYIHLTQSVNARYVYSGRLTPPTIMLISNSKVHFPIAIPVEHVFKKTTIRYTIADDKITKIYQTNISKPLYHNQKYYILV